MKRYIIVSLFSLIGFTGPSALADEFIINPATDAATSDEQEPQAIREITYRSEIVRPTRFYQTYLFEIPAGVRADEIQIRGVSGAVQVQRAWVVFGNGNTRNLPTLQGMYNRGGQVGVRTRAATLNNPRNIQEVYVTVRKGNDRWTLDSFRLVMGLSRANIPEDDEDYMGIRIISASYGRNVGAPRNNALDEMSDACDGRRQCSFMIDYTKLGGDPAPGYPKDFSYSWACDGQVRAAGALVAAEAHGKIVRLSCRD